MHSPSSPYIIGTRELTKVVLAQSERAVYEKLPLDRDAKLTPNPHTEQSLAQ